MKKIVSIIILAAIISAMSLGVFASDNGAFTSSPSEYKAPSVKSTTESVEVSVTGYSDHNDLTDEKKTDIEAAYTSIKNAQSVTELTSALESKVSGASNVAVKELFYISATGTTEGEKYTVTLDHEDLTGFLALVQFKNNEWTVLDAKVNGNEIEVELTGSAPLAVIVGEPSTSAPTTNAPVTTSAGEKKSGCSCGSSIAMTAIITVVALGACVISKKNGQN